jgi:5'-deoxynucleotidase YfbR-like HD superfamily hydrolase
MLSNRELLTRQRLAFIRQGSEVERFHTKRMIQRNDVGHHSFHVAWLASLMAANYSAKGRHRIVMAALAHDLAEHITGDIPGDFKREMGLREKFGAYEQDLFASVAFNFEGALAAPEKRILKLADMMEGAFFCVSEAGLGNARVGIVYANFRAYISKFAPFSEIERDIIDFIDDLWAHYGVTDAPGWSKTAHTDKSRKDDSIMGTEEEDWGAFAQERDVATPPGNCKHSIAEFDAANNVRRCPCGAVQQAGEPWRYPSEPAKLGDAPVPNQPQHELMDDRASKDLPQTVQDEALPANARQYGGDHYKSVGYEHWDLVIDTGLDYFQGCATKYVTRAFRHPGGPRINLLKAIHYIDKRAEAEQAARLGPADNIYNVSDITTYAVGYDLNALQEQALKDIIGGRWAAARLGLQLLLGELPDQEPTDR